MEQDNAIKGVKLFDWNPTEDCFVYMTLEEYEKTDERYAHCDFVCDAMCVDGKWIDLSAPKGIYNQEDFVKYKCGFCGGSFEYDKENGIVFCGHCNWPCDDNDIEKEIFNKK